MYYIYQNIRDNRGYMTEDGTLGLSLQDAALFDTWIEAAQFAYDSYMQIMDDEEFADEIFENYIIIRPA